MVMQHSTDYRFMASAELQCHLPLRSQNTYFSRLLNESAKALGPFVLSLTVTVVKVPTNFMFPKYFFLLSVLRLLSYQDKCPLNLFELKNKQFLFEVLL